jgi:ligand-binding SRPBCC domain-containing protein
MRHNQTVGVAPGAAVIGTGSNRAEFGRATAAETSPKVAVIGIRQDLALRNAKTNDPPPRPRRIVGPMPIIQSRSWVAAPIEEVFTFFDDPANLGRLMPPPVSIRLERVEPAPPRPGSVFEFSYGIGPVRRRWIVRLVDRVPNERFVDETVTGPVARFNHSHTFTPARSGTWIDDRIDFHVGPDGPIGDAIDAAAGLVMRMTFVWRAARQRQLLRSR